MHPYVQLAQQAVAEHFLDGTNLKTANKLPAELANVRAGVFVTIYNGVALRGCIGTIAPTKKNIAKEIITNTISAATSDYRFNPITASELPELNFEISVLSRPEPAASLADLDPKKYGVIVQAGLKRGLFLPDLEGIVDVEKQVLIAAQKAGIDLDLEEIKLSRFTVAKYK